MYQVNNFLFPSLVELFNKSFYDAQPSPRHGLVYTGVSSHNVSEGGPYRPGYTLWKVINEGVNQ